MTFAQKIVFLKNLLHNKTMTFAQIAIRLMSPFIRV